MNLVDKILVDPITRGLKFFTKGGVPAYVTQVRGRTDGSSPAAGEVGENKKASVVRSASIALSPSVDQLITPQIVLTAGVWLVSGAITFEVLAASTVTTGTALYGVTSTAGHAFSDTIGVPTSGEVEYRFGFALGASVVQSFPIQSYQVVVANGSTLSLQTIATAAITGTVKVFGSLEATRIA
jgi:hypothetical protein